MQTVLMVVVLTSNYDCWSNCSPKTDDCSDSSAAFGFVANLANEVPMLVAPMTMDNLGSNNVT